MYRPDRNGWLLCNTPLPCARTRVRIFYNLVTQLCQAFQEFNGPYIITQGGPRNSTTLISLLIYNSAFKQYDMGMASAMAWVMFVILMIFTTIAFLSQKYWVFYSDEEG